MPHAQPELSIIMPCYNEEAIVASTVRRLVRAFEDADHRLELVVVDNGSEDGTGQVIEGLARKYEAVVPHRVEVNQGYGHGVLSTIPVCSAEWIGIIPADGQVDAEDVVRLFESARASHGRVVAKVRRRFRMDGLQRKIVSTAYNLFVRTLWPGLRSLDVNGSPKILPRRYLLAMELQSKGWFLDAELMIKAHELGLEILEFNVFARMRGNGISHVSAANGWEFFRNLLLYRFAGRLSGWRERVAGSDVSASQREPGTAPGAVGGVFQEPGVRT